MRILFAGMVAVAAVAVADAVVAVADLVAVTTRVVLPGIVAATFSEEAFGSERKRWHRSRYWPFRTKSPPPHRNRSDP